MQKYRIDFALIVLTGNLTRYKTIRPLVEQDANVISRWYPIRTWLPDDPLRIFPGALRIRLRHALDTWRLVLLPPADAVIMHAFETYTLYSVMRWLLRRKTMLINNPDGGLPAAQPGIRGWHRRVAIRSTALFVPWSRSAAALISMAYPDIPRERICVIHPGINLERWPLRVDPPATDRFRILFVGGDLKRKGARTLLDAFESGPADHCELHIATQSAQPSNDFDEYRMRAERNPHIHLHLNLTPNSPELQRLYGESDIFVLPTDQDYSSLVSLEAMATGIPVITTSVGGIPDIVIDGETGLLIPPRDPDALVAAVERLRSDTALRAKLVRQGRAHVEAHFDAHKNTQRLLTLTKALIDVRRGISMSDVPLEHTVDSTSGNRSTAATYI